MKQNLILIWMHLSVLFGITLFIYQYQVGGREAVELYLSYLPLLLVTYKMLETPANRIAAIIIFPVMAAACLFSSFYFHAYYLIFASSAICAAVAPSLHFGKKPMDDLGDK